MLCIDNLQAGGGCIRVRRREDEIGMSVLSRGIIRLNLLLNIHEAL